MGATVAVHETHTWQHDGGFNALLGGNGDTTSMELTMHVAFVVEQNKSSGAGAEAGVSAGVAAGNLCDAGTGVAAGVSVDT